MTGVTNVAVVLNYWSTVPNRVGPARTAEAQVTITNSAATTPAASNTAGLTNHTWRRARIGLGAAGILVAFLAAPSAFADSAEAAAPADNTVVLSAAEPSATVELPVAQSAEAPALAGQPAAAPQVAATGSTTDAAAQAPTAAQSPAAVQHLSSPENLPPGTTSDAPSQGKMDYLRYLWNAVRSQDVTPSTAMLLLAQRPMAADAKAPSGVASAPSGPVGSSAPVASTVDAPPSP